MPRALVPIAFLLGVAATWPRLPDPAPPDAAGFSADRAMGHVRAWATEPRPTGSAAHVRVVGQVEAALAATGLEVAREVAGDVTNLVARPPGAGADGVWLVAHSDSVPGAPGAADDGLGLGVVVEAARVVPGVRVLITDGEERGLDGAVIHARAAGPGQRRVVINVEARGTEGPAYMFQTAGPVMGAWRASGCRAQATSLARAVYDLLPNDTDFTVFRARGWSGYDLALIQGAWRYHSADDTPENLDPRSVQQVGDCVVGLARAWLGQPIARDDEGKPVYFQVPRGTAVLPPWLVRGLGLALLLVVPWRARELLRGLGGWLAAAGIAAVLGLGLHYAASAWVPDFWSRDAEMQSPGGLWAAAALVGLLSTRAARTGAHAAYAALAAILAVAWPVAGYLLLPGGLAAALLARGSGRAATIPALFAGMLVGPVLCAIFPALTTRMLPVLALVPVLTVGWLVVPARRAEA